MRTLPIFVALLFVFAYALSANAYSAAALHSSLQRYGVSNSIIDSLTPYTINYSTSQYVALYNGNDLYFVINASDNYSMMDNASQIFGVIKQYVINSSTVVAAQYISSMRNLMSAYENSAAPALNSCLRLTGLSSGFTCNITNNCRACLSVPYCSYFYQGPGTQIAGGSGISGPLGQGIMALEKSYDALNASYNAFYAAASGINASNVAYKRAQLESSLINISSESQLIHENRLFPAIGVNTSELQQCNYYSNLNYTPWYCQSMGFCTPAPSYNVSILANISKINNELAAMPLTTPQIMSMAINASNIASKYAVPYILQQKLNMLNGILNTTLVNYGTLLNNTMTLLGHISNYTLASDINELQMEYANLTSNYTTINMIAANALLAKEMASTFAVYSSLNATYTKLSSLAFNNTLLLLKAQLNSGYNANTAKLATEQNILDNTVMGRISNPSATYNALLALHAGASSAYNSSLPLISFTQLARSIDSVFARGLESRLNMNYSNAVAFVPIAASIFSFVISFVIIGAVFALFLSLKLHRKLKMDRRTMRNWKMLFIVLMLLAVIYIALTYVYAAKANSFAPLASFDSAVHGSSYVAIFLNGTPTIQQFDCASGISKSLISMGKKPLLVSEVNGTCTIDNQTKPLGYCMNGYALLNVPMIFLTNTNATTSSLSIYSMYGSVMSYSGNSTQMSLCYPSKLLN